MDIHKVLLEMRREREQLKRPFSRSNFSWQERQGDEGGRRLGWQR